MHYSTSSNTLGLELVVVTVCLTCCCLAYPRKVYVDDNQSGVIPVNLVMSPLQMIDLPDYHTEQFPTTKHTGGAKRKRHGHGSGGNHHTQSQSADTSTSGSCCPSVEEIVEPRGGKSKTGHLVELFQSSDFHQRFHEISCAANVVDQPCRFVNENVISQSRCVQQYSYSYALVRDIGASEVMVGSKSEWRLDHIRVRSGCSCIISP